MRNTLRRTHLWLMIALLYFSQGIPLSLAMEALPALLRRMCHGQDRRRQKG